MTNPPSITIMGLGYVGLCTAVSFASKGFRVSGYEIDEGKVEQINSGKATFFEPQLDTLLERSLRNGFVASRKIMPADIYFITVGTPSKADGGIDLKYVRSASHDLGRSLRNSDGCRLVVMKSTVTPGTTEKVAAPIIQAESGKAVGKDLGLVANPEFLREGSAIEDSLKPDRLIIGEMERKSGDTLLNFYGTLYRNRMPEVLRTTPVNAELIKYANNAFLATKVSFINMIANLCQKVPGADVEVVARGIGVDNRIGMAFLRAGPGWGGSCWPKDLRALKTAFSESGVEAPILDATMEVNESQPFRLVEAAKELLGDLKGKRVAVLGLSFKPDTDDVREAVSLRVIGALLDEGAKVSAYDPAAMENARKVLGGKIAYASSSVEAIKDADCCIIMTEWSEFGKLGPEDFRSNMKNLVVIDGRRVYDPSKLSGMRYAAIGLNRTQETRILGGG